MKWKKKFVWNGQLLNRVSKKRCTTQPINNTGLGFNRQGLCIFIMFAKSLGFCFETKKEKTKPKDFAICVAESKTLVCSRTVHSQPVSIYWVRYTNILYRVIETSFTLFKLHLKPKFRCYALERINDYGTKN